MFFFAALCFGNMGSKSHFCEESGEAGPLSAIPLLGGGWVPCTLFLYLPHSISHAERACKALRLPGYFTRADDLSRKKGVKAPNHLSVHCDHMEKLAGKEFSLPLDYSKPQGGAGYPLSS